MASSSAGVTIGELEANYPLYCKAMKILIRNGSSTNQLKRTLCWDRLQLLHRSLPRQYKSPERLMQIMRDNQSGAQWIDSISRPALTTILRELTFDTTIFARVSLQLNRCCINDLGINGWWDEVPIATHTDTKIIHNSLIQTTRIFFCTNRSMTEANKAAEDQSDSNHRCHG